MHYSIYDYLYPIFIFLFGIFMIISPRTLMRKAKYDEEGLKAESWVKKAGVGLCILAPLLAIFLYYKMNA